VIRAYAHHRIVEIWNCSRRERGKTLVFVWMKLHIRLVLLVVGVIQLSAGYAVVLAKADQRFTLVAIGLHPFFSCHSLMAEMECFPHVSKGQSLLAELALVDAQWCVDRLLFVYAVDEADPIAVKIAISENQKILF